MKLWSKCGAAVVLTAAMSGVFAQAVAQVSDDALVAKLGPGFRAGTADVNGTTIYYVRGGSGPAVIFLHGFPEDWYEFHRIMPRLAQSFTVVAMDLRGVGGSRPTENGYDAANMAKDAHEVAEKLGLEHIYLVGHDVGGMVAYAYLRRYPETLRGVMILDVPVAGIGPWDQLQTIPEVWHIRFHQIPGLGEKLVAGRQAIYFGYFFTGSHIDDAEVAHYAQSYADGGHLRSAFEPYRAFPEDARFNAAQKGRIDVPVIYGAGALSPFARFVPAFAAAMRAHGCARVETTTVEGTSHYIADVQPERLAALVERYAGPQPAHGNGH